MNNRTVEEAAITRGLKLFLPPGGEMNPGLVLCF